jgi:hypothetical protein
VYGVTRKAATVLVLAVVLAAGCSGGKSPGQWFGLGKSSAKQEGVFFAGEDALTVRDAPKASGKIVGQLSLHQKVVRSKLTDGYALVRVVDGSLAGWVVNAKLLWKLPGSPPAETEGAAAVEETPAVVEETPASPETSQTPPPAPEAPKAPAPKSGTGASVFDPY